MFNFYERNNMQIYNLNVPYSLQMVLNNKLHIAIYLFSIAMGCVFHLFEKTPALIRSVLNICSNCMCSIMHYNQYISTFFDYESLNNKIIINKSSTPKHATPSCNWNATQLWPRIHGRVRSVCNSCKWL